MTASEANRILEVVADLERIKRMRKLTGIDNESLDRWEQTVIQELRKMIDITPPRKQRAMLPVDRSSIPPPEQA